ncbi:MerR family DNA-binding transcriptional regulator, partial [Vibrio breoganii]
MKKHLIRIGQLPKILGISTSTLYRWIENGLFIPPIRLG